MNREQLISPLLLRAVGHAGAAGQGVCLLIPVLCLAEPIAWFAGFPGASMIIGHVSDSLCLLVLALLSMLCPWCHEVLVAKRGSAITRLLSVPVGCFGFLLFLDSFYSGITLHNLLTDRDLVSVGLSLALLLTVIININNIAAAPLWLRICLPIACLCYLGCVLTIGVISLLLPFTILKLTAALLLVKPMALLRRCAPRIASLPDSDG